jgi:ribosomal protein S18 acetylase RimI-like enzyme
MAGPQQAKVATPYRISVLTERPGPEMWAALDDLLHEYYSVILRKLRDAGMDHTFTTDQLSASFWPDVQKIMPPNGRLIVAQDEVGRLLGFATLQIVRPDAAEVKRLFVRAEAAGQGLGSALFATWIEQARAMGLRRLLLNVIKTNHGPIAMYERAGFQRIERYPECADPIEADPYFIYMKYDLQ